MSDKLDSGKKSYQRSFKNYLINPGYQLKYIFWISLTGLALILIYSTLMYRYVHENYALLIELSPMTDEVKAQLYRELREIVVKVSGISFLFLTVCSFFGLFLSHRTAGPMFHFKRVFGEIQAGQLDRRVHLRPKDDFRDVAEAFNKMMDSIQRKP
jgi:HAMP domain-containing protein